MTWTFTIDPKFTAEEGQLADALLALSGDRRRYLLTIVSMIDSNLRDSVFNAALTITSKAGPEARGE